MMGQKCDASVGSSEFTGWNSFGASRGDIFIDGIGVLNERIRIFSKFGEQGKEPMQYDSTVVG